MDDVAAAYLAACDRQDWPEVDRLELVLNQAGDQREARLRGTDALAGAARWYARNGIAVFPLAVRGKTPITKRGFKDATTDLEQITAWWEQTPAANIGSPTGQTFDVIDIDGPDGLSSMLERFPTLDQIGPEVIGRVTTPRGGGHHLYIAPSGTGNKASLYPGVDYRGVGGYVVVPPSIGANGRMYRWLRPLAVTA